MQTTHKKGLTVKDLVTTGIFSAFFLAFALVGGIFFVPSPVLTFYMPVGSALLCPIWFVTGMHWVMALGYLVMGLAADLVAGIRQYRSKLVNSLSYLILSLGDGHQRLCGLPDAAEAV